MIFHPLAEHHLVLVVKTIGKLVRAVRAFITDLGNIGEEIGSHDSMVPWSDARIGVTESRKLWSKTIDQIAIRLHYV